MPTVSKIFMPDPSFGAEVPRRTPYVLQPSAAVNLARLHEPQYAEAINVHRGRFNLLDYFFSSHRMIVSAIESGVTPKELYRWTCEQFQPRVPCSYPQFRVTLAKFRHLMEIPSRQERVKILAAQLRGAPATNRLSTKNSPAPSAPAVRDLPADVTPSKPSARAFLPPTPAGDVNPTAHTAAFWQSPPAPLVSPVSPPPKPRPTLASLITESPPVDPHASAPPTETLRPPPPVPVPPCWGMLPTGGSAEFLRRLTAPDKQSQSTATLEELSQARMRARELKILQENAIEEATRRSLKP